jgi:hypothetical protein
MRRQTILLAAALAIATPSTAFTESRGAARETAIQHPQGATTPDRLILRIEDAKTSSSIAPINEAALLAELAEAHKRRDAAASDAAERPDTRTNERAPSGGDAATTASPIPTPSADSMASETSGFTAHHGVLPTNEYFEDRERVSLKLAPVTTPSHRDGDWETLRLDETVDGADVSGVAVGLSFKLN